jgi:hypothetical protein
MKNLIYASCAATVLLCSGCSVLPEQAELSRLPVITYGTPAPAGDNFILFFPAGQPIPTDVAIVGSLLKDTSNQRLVVSLNKDVYAFKRWVSFDNKHWVDARDTIDVKVEVRIPGPNHTKPGEIKVQIDNKSTS